MVVVLNFLDHNVDKLKYTRLKRSPLECFAKIQIANRKNADDF